jgi:hypothetical protein
MLQVRSTLYIAAIPQCTRSCHNPYRMQYVTAESNDVWGRVRLPIMIQMQGCNGETIQLMIVGCVWDVHRCAVANGKQTGIKFLRLFIPLVPMPRDYLVHPADGKYAPCQVLVYLWDSVCVRLRQWPRHIRDIGSLP